MKTGWALSGGGARGLAHLGVAKALGEFAISFDMLSGTSAGALTGLFLAQGYTPDETLEIIIKTNFYKALKPAVSLRGLLKIDKLELLLRPYFTSDSFSSLGKPFFVGATNVKTGKVRFFSSGEVIRPVVASCSIPVVFEPILIEGESYMDGGVVNNLPVEPLFGNVDRIVGIHTNPISGSYQFSNMRSLMERSLLLAINENVIMRKLRCDLFVEPSALKDYRVFDFRKAREIFQVGYTYTHTLLTSQSALSSLSAD